MKALLFSLFGGLLLLISSPSLNAQSEANDTYHKVYRSYVVGDLDGWLDALLTLERQYGDSKNPLWRYRLALAQYGYVGVCLAREDEEAAVERELNRAESSLDFLRAQNAYRARAHALSGALLAMRIGLNPMKAVTLGSRSTNYLESAIELDPREPAAWVEMGNMRYHAPGLFGGDKEEAVRCFARAVELFDARPERRRNNWQYLHALAYLGQAYEEVGRRDKAIATYRKALAYEPDFKWVRQQLLPKLVE